MQIEDIKMPSSREAEDYIVGCILIDSSIADEVLNSLTAADFYYPDNRTLMEVIEILADEQKDINSVTVINELNRISKLEMAGGYDHISEILNNIPSTANIDSYINVIQEASVERQLANACDKVRSDILKGKYVHRELMQNSERALFDIINGQNTDDFKKVNLLTDEVIEVIENSKENEGGLIGIDTGFEELNKITNGFKKSELIILAARPAVGKSAFALNVAAAACKTKKNVVLFSLEMGSGQLLMRMLASQSGVDLSRITSGNLDDEQMALILQAKVVLDKYQLYIDQSSTNNVRDIKAKCQKLHREGNLDLIIIDYLQLLVSGDKNVGNIVQEVTKISRALKQMAIQFGVPVLALSQLSRDIEKRPDKKPVLADLRDSGSIEQDADIVMFLYRENDKKEEDTSKIIQSAKTKLLVAKNRQGRTGEVNLMFKGKYSQFIEVDD